MDSGKPGTLEKIECNRPECIGQSLKAGSDISEEVKCKEFCV